jgi:hypothetical protein
VRLLAGLVAEGAISIKASAQVGRRFIGQPARWLRSSIGVSPNRAAFRRDGTRYTPRTRVADPVKKLNHAESRHIA